MSDKCHEFIDYRESTKCKQKYSPDDDDICNCASLNRPPLSYLTTEGTGAWKYNRNEHNCTTISSLDTTTLENFSETYYDSEEAEGTADETHIVFKKYAYKSDSLPAFDEGNNSKRKTSQNFIVGKGSATKDVMITHFERKRENRRENPIYSDSMYFGSKETPVLDSNHIICSSKIQPRYERKQTKQVNYTENMKKFHYHSTVGNQSATKVCVERAHTERRGGVHVGAGIPQTVGVPQEYYDHHQELINGLTRGGRHRR